MSERYSWEKKDDEFHLSIARKKFWTYVSESISLSDICSGLAKKRGPYREEVISIYRGLTVRNAAIKEMS